MAKLPNGDKAIVPIEKFTKYALNPNHFSGQHKARVFKSILGLTIENAIFLQATVRNVAKTHDAIPKESTPYGQRYVIDFTLTIEKGTAVVRSAWMIRNHEDIPYLVSCYVIKGK